MAGFDPSIEDSADGDRGDTLLGSTGSAVKRVATCETLVFHMFAPVHLL